MNNKIKIVSDGNELHLHKSSATDVTYKYIKSVTKKDTLVTWLHSDYDKMLKNKIIIEI